MDFKSTKILVVDDEVSICEILAGSLEDEGFEVSLVNSGSDAIEALKTFNPSIVLLDVWMPGEMDGIDVLKKIQTLKKAPQVVVMSGHGTIETAVNAVKLGAWDFVEKPISMDKILITIQNMLKFTKKEEERKNLLNQLKESYLIEGASEHMQSIKSRVVKFSKTNSPYLIQGQEGVGKTLIARNIHYLSKSAGHPFVVVNCNSIPEGLQADEIFGHEPNASSHTEAARGGTLYFKNIENLDQASQDLLVSVLNEKKSNQEEAFRVVASTSKDLKKLCQDGSFREDLYVKLSVMTLEILPLKNRKEDIPTLFESFSHDQSRKSGESYRPIQPQALEKLNSYDWPGNVRELKNFVERLYILSQNEVFDLYDLGYAGLQIDQDSLFSNSGDFREARSQFEKEYLTAKLLENEGNISKTSEAIGLERSYLHRKIKSYNIDIQS